MGITEIIVVLVIALIVIPPDKLPEVMRTVGKVLRELRLASNTVVRELTEAVDDPLQLKRPPAAIARPSVIETLTEGLTSAAPAAARAQSAVGKPPASAPTPSAVAVAEPVVEPPAQDLASTSSEAAPVEPLKP